MTEPLLLAVDQGTTGTTCLLVRPDGSIARRAYREVPVSYPRPGWVEQDPEDLWVSVASAAAEVCEGMATRPAAIGITNQRETVVVVERGSLRPVAPAIVWQCRRSAGICEEHRAAGEEPELRRRTGLLLDPYFTATKIEWLLRERPELRARAERGELLATTVDGWLVARMTGGRALAVDAGNASRTLLYDLAGGDFDPELCAVFGIPHRMLPPVVGSAEQVGTTDPYLFLGMSVPIAGIAGDQQAALFGQACVRPGMAKNTYGTGSFVLVNAGAEPVAPGPGLLTTVAWRIGGADTFALEGSIFTTGAALRWLRDGIGLIRSYDEVGPLAETVPDTGGVHFVPALAGLGAPFWDPDARGAFVGMTAGTTRAHLVRAVLESMTLRTRDVVEAMEASGAPAFAELRVDGGASVIDALCRWQSDLLGIPVARAATAETTAVGAAMLAAVGVGL
ncbi:MAG TPA: glycerol kinase GlpK, partial [Candidatus Dormibacteraeota bacterium]|nr:glycerol kinase GlpK [Candidatus Dormibacteraeota bacterium]